MGEESSLPHYAEHQPASFPRPLSPPVHQSNGAPHSHPEEEPYTIRCICGFADDDGNTVLCEQCETWQHIECYYYPTLTVPDVHKCVECSPRILDSINATQRQRRIREAVNGSDDRKARRAGPKTHKRSKTKEPPGPFAPHQVNGGSYNDRQGHDRASRSPRDHPPPSKRPKTSHRHSGSVNNNLQSANVGHHGRTGSSTLPLASPVKRALVDCPPDYFSPDFINVHQTNTDFTLARANLFLNIGVSDLLSTWLDEPDAFSLATHGKSHGDVFMQHPTPIEELETPVRKEVREDTSALFHGSHPVWPYLVADRDLLEGHFVGELIGSIGHLHDYKADPSNNWDRLRHPDHFVFFHPHLPIYIDCRTEGTILRYARRSCRPNIKINTIITGAREYHFCFTATCDIPEGAELTVAWDLESDPQLRDYLYRLSGSSSSLDESQRAYLISWVETVLAHFGDCACPAFDGMCLMERFDHRVAPLENPGHTTANFPRKRQASKRSPSRLIDAPDSRAGSETLLRPADEEMGDTTPSPRSSRSRTSRETSPANHELSLRGVPELSERDKKKLIQQEKLFQKIEQEEQGHRKKKRRSGSTLNTPSTASFKQAGRTYFSTSNPDTPAPGMESRPLDNDSSYFNSEAVRSPDTQTLGAQSPPSRVPSRTIMLEQIPTSTRPIYADASAQTENRLDADCPQVRIERKPYVPLSQRLLRRNHLNTLRQIPNGRESSNTHPHSPNSPPTQTPEVLVPLWDSTRPQPAPTLSQDMEWQRDDNAAPSENSSTVIHPGSDDGAPQPNDVELTTQSANVPSKPPTTPWSSGSTSTNANDHQHRNNYRAAKLHVDLPPPEFPSTTESKLPATISGASLTGNVVQSPQSAGPAPMASMSAPILTPNHTSLTQPSPVKKKLSLSDYSQRLKSKTPGIEKPQSLGQPGSTTPPGTGSSPLSISSKINDNNSTVVAVTGDPTLPVMNDAEVSAVKMEPDTPQL